MHEYIWFLNPKNLQKEREKGAKETFNLAKVRQVKSIEKGKIIGFILSVKFNNFIVLSGGLRLRIFILCSWSVGIIDVFISALSVKERE